MSKFSDDIRKPWPKATLKDIKNLINNQTFIVEYPDKYEPVTPRMDVYKDKIKYDGSQDKPKLRIVVRGDLHNKEISWIYLVTKIFHEDYEIFLGRCN